MIHQSDVYEGGFVTIDSVSKWYGPVIAVNDVSTRLPAGITGLVGANGAGKSTLIKLLTGQLRPSIGKVSIGGINAWSARAKSLIGYCPDNDAFYEEMTGRQFVTTIARFHGIRSALARRRTEEVLSQVGMADRADRRLRGYSKGMRQRIKLAQALVSDPHVIVLDEPLNGVDPVGRAELVQLFRELAAQGKAVLVSSHILEQMDRLADQILFMCRGRILASGTLPEIRELLDDYPRQVCVRSDQPRKLASRLLQLETVQGVRIKDTGELLVEVIRIKELYSTLNDIVVADDIEIEAMMTTDASTEAVFDYLMRRARRF